MKKVAMSSSKPFESRNDNLKGKEVVAIAFITTNYWQLPSIKMQNLPEQWGK